MTRARWTSAALVVAALSAATPALAQDLIPRVDSIFSFATGETPGCAVAVSVRGEVKFSRSYGLADLEQRRPITPNTAFDIGSSHKQFVAASVLLLAEDGKLRLDDDVRRHVPELPDYGHRITLSHLLSHTSGLRDWPPLQAMAPEGSEVLPLILKQRELNFIPGAEFSYSNSGYVLLKEIVERVSGGSFADFTKRRLFEPLGMQHSSYVPDIMQGTGDRALAYSREGNRFEPSIRLGNRRGGGTVISTTGDLLRWNDALTKGTLGDFVTAQLVEPSRLNNGRRLTYARGLLVQHDVPGGPLVSHSGGAAGFSAWVGRFTGEGVSAVVLCNVDPISATQLAARSADLVLAPAPRGPRPGAPRPVAGVDVAPRAGLYFDTRSAAPMRLQVNNGRLGIANGPPLVPVSPESFKPAAPMLFYRSEDNFEIKFSSADEFTLTSQEGEVSTFVRAQAWSPSAAEVATVAGRYCSDEVNRVFLFAPAEGGITMRIEGDAERVMTLQAVARDTYMLNLGIVRLKRDASGAVTGVEYGNPVLRSMTFNKLP